MGARQFRIGGRWTEVDFRAAFHFRSGLLRVGQQATHTGIAADFRDFLADSVLVPVLPWTRVDIRVLVGHFRTFRGLTVQLLTPVFVPGSLL
jgi:hypothetical protein